MALRLDQAIIRGWIDNTTPGETRGGIELLGMQRPLELVLKGNCWRDLAGTRLDFVNPDPQPQPDVVEFLHGLHRGLVGDMTASQKVKSLLISQEEMIEYLEAKKELPFEWKNSLSLEWYSLANGRVVVEATDFELRMSNHAWELDDAGERAQRLENANALEHFMQLISQANDAESQVVNEFEDNADEFEWERRLRVRDSLEEAVDFLSPLDAEECDEAHGVLESEMVEGRAVVVQHANKLQLDVMMYLGNSFLDSGPRGELAMAVNFVFETLDEVCPEKYVEGMEKGYRIAMLKRSADAVNVAIAACNTLEMEDDGFKLIRNDFFTLRDMILDLIRELRDGSD